MKPPKFLNDQNLNIALKSLGVVIMATILLFIITLFDGFWQAIGRAAQTVIVPFALAWLISLIVFPIVRHLERRGVRPRALTVTVVYLLMGLFVAGLAINIVPLFTSQLRQFFAVDYPTIVRYFENDFRNEFVLGPQIYDFFANAIASSNVINNAIENFFDSLTRIIPSTFYGIVMVIAILPILLLFYLLDYEKVNKALASLVPERYKGSGSELASHLNVTVGAYIRGQFFLMLAIGTVATIVYRLIGLEYYFIFGVLVGLANIIPYFGALIAMIPVVAYAFITQDTTTTPLLIVAINIVLQFIEGSIFQPVIMGKQLALHPLIIILSILLFGSLFGVLGIIFASPIAATLRVLYTFYQTKKREQAEAISMIEPQENTS